MAEAGLRPPERLFLRYPHELSGGQKQRVLIAGALALRPELVLADEPVSSLDASIRGEILALLLRLREELGMGVVVVTHDLGLAWNIADRIAVMYLGRVVECGHHRGGARPRRGTPTPGPCCPWCPRSSSSSRWCSPARSPTRRRIPSGCRFHPRCPALADGSAERAGVAEACRTEPLEVLPATGEHRAACHLDAVLSSRSRRRPSHHRR